MKNSIKNFISDVRKILKYDNTKFLGGWITQCLSAVILLLLVIFYWKLKFSLFYSDEWDWLRPIANGNFEIFKPHNEHFLPIIKVFYEVQLTIFHNDPMYMHYVMLFIHFITAFLVGFVIWLLLKKNILAILASLIFALHPFQWQNVLWTFQSQIIFNVMFVLLALIFTKLFLDTLRKRYYFLALFFTFIQLYTFGSGLIMPIVIMMFFLLFRSKKVSLKLVIPYIIIFIVNVIIYKTWGAANVTAFADLKSLDNIKKLIEYYAYAVFNNLGRTLTLKETPIFTLSLLFYTLIVIASTFLVNRDSQINKEKWKLFAFGYVWYFITFILIALSRFTYGIEQSYSPRYAYYYIIPVLIVLLYIIKLFWESKIIWFRYTFKVIITLAMIGFFLLSYQQVNKLKEKQQFIYVKDYKEMKQYQMNSTYDPVLHDLHPFQTKEQLLDTIQKLNLINDKNTRRVCGLQPVYTFDNDCYKL